MNEDQRVNQRLGQKDEGGAAVNKAVRNLAREQGCAIHEKPKVSNKDDFDPKKESSAERKEGVDTVDQDYYGG